MDWNATKAAIKPHLPIQYLVNNAAMAILDPFLEVKPEDFDTYVLASFVDRSIDESFFHFRLFNINVRSIICVSQVSSFISFDFLLIKKTIFQEIARDLIERKLPGSIVNVSSQASAAALRDHSIYCSTKAAVDGLTRVMALELGPHQVRTNDFRRFQIRFVLFLFNFRFE